MNLRRDPAPESLRSACTRDVPVPPYHALAPVYDLLMWHIDYIYWADYLAQLSIRYHAPRGAWCEGGCGTGSIALRHAQTGYTMYGFDQSSAMIASAKAKSVRDGCTVHFFTADFRDFKLRDLAYLFVVYDGINYLLEPIEVEQFFVLANKSLQPNGLLVIDVCTERNSVRNLYDWYDSRTSNGWKYWRHSWYDPKNRLHHNDFEIASEENPATVYLETHVQRIYRIREMVDWGERNGFLPLAILGDITFSPGTEANDRVHIVMRKQRPVHI